MPNLEWAHVEQEDMQSWMEGKMAQDEALMQEWENAWSSYMSAVEQPWNDFLDSAEALIIKDHAMDTKTDEEVISYIIDNTWVDGQSLREMFPEVEQVFTHMR